MVEYLQTIVRPFLKEPEALKILHTIDERGALLTMTVSKADMGRIIGREGAHMKKIREIMSLYGLFHDAKISVVLTEPDGSRSNSDYKLITN